MPGRVLGPYSGIPRARYNDHPENSHRNLPQAQGRPLSPGLHDIYQNRPISPENNGIYTNRRNRSPAHYRGRAPSPELYRNLPRQGEPPLPPGPSRAKRGDRSRPRNRMAKRQETEYVEQVGHIDFGEDDSLPNDAHDLVERIYADATPRENVYTQPRRGRSEERIIERDFAHNRRHRGFSPPPPTQRPRDFSPRARGRDFSPRARELSPRARGREFSPLARERDFSPRGRELSPRARGHDFSPLARERDFSPRAQGRDFSPLARERDFSPRARELSPRARGRDFSPLARERDFSPRARELSPRARGRDFSPRGNDFPPRRREFSPQRNDHLPRGRDISRRPREFPPSRYDFSPTRGRDFSPRPRRPFSPDQERERARERVILERGLSPRRKEFPPGQRLLSPQPRREQSPRRHHSRDNAVERSSRDDAVDRASRNNIVADLYNGIYGPPVPVSTDETTSRHRKRQRDRRNAFSPPRNPRGVPNGPAHFRPPGPQPRPFFRPPVPLGARAPPIPLPGMVRPPPPMNHRLVRPPIFGPVPRYAVPPGVIAGHGPPRLAVGPHRQIH